MYDDIVLPELMLFISIVFWLSVADWFEIMHCYVFVRVMRSVDFNKYGYEKNFFSSFCHFVVYSTGGSAE